MVHLTRSAVCHWDDLFHACKYVLSRPCFTSQVETKGADQQNTASVAVFPGCLCHLKSKSLYLFLSARSFWIVFFLFGRTSAEGFSPTSAHDTRFRTPSDRDLSLGHPSPCTQFTPPSPPTLDLLGKMMESIASALAHELESAMICHRYANLKHAFLCCQHLSVCF